MSIDEYLACQELSSDRDRLEWLMPILDAAMEIDK